MKNLKKTIMIKQTILTFSLIISLFSCQKENLQTENQNATPKNATILKSWNLENSKTNSFEQFEIKENDITKTVYLEKNNDGFILKGLTYTERVITNAALPSIPPSGKPCAQQEVAQWQYFNTNTAPSLLTQANNTCHDVFYCLQITCNGKPTVAYLLVIHPNNPNCIVEQQHSIRD